MKLYTCNITKKYCGQVDHVLIRARSLPHAYDLIISEYEPELWTFEEPRLVNKVIQCSQENNNNK